MLSIARWCNDVAIVFTRSDLTWSRKLLLLSEYYALHLRVRVFGLKSQKVRFNGMHFHASSLTNLLTIIREVFIYGDYYFSTKKKDPTIIDCGANIGVSCLFYKSIYPNAQITAFEPSKRNFVSLENNVKSNNLEYVTLVCAAAAKDVGERVFWESDTRPGSSTLVDGVKEAKSKTGKHRFTESLVRTVKLSTYVIDTVDCLKMDIEGAESEVLHELEDAGVLHNIKRIIFEFHQNESNVSNKLTDVLCLLERNGYGVAIINNEIQGLSEDVKNTTSRHFLIRADRNEN